MVVTTPKFPPPCSAHSSSGSSSVEASPAISEHDLGAEQIVGRQPGRAEQRAAAPPRESPAIPTTPAVRVGTFEAIMSGGRHDITGSASASAHRCVLLDTHTAHLAEVDHQPAVAARPTGPVMTSSANGHTDTGLAGPTTVAISAPVRGPHDQSRPCGHRAVPRAPTTC